ncbi:MAG: hypothetical protein DSZ23_06095 [Thermodesulfatator sp.]|nr:MAG: hypothetical protein DSZ23_06095 [Thermodesulfatator sp.]
MTKLKRIKKYLFAVPVVLAVAMFLSSQALALTCKVTPSTIPISLGYHGTKVQITGEGLDAPDLIVQIHSPPGEEHLKYKGKAGGIFWMKLGTMTFKNVPGVYLVYSTRPSHELLSPEKCAELSIGFDALRNKAEIESNLKDLDRDKWLTEFMKFKKVEHLYLEQSGNIKVDSANHSYELDIDWPFEAPPGEYDVEVFAVRDGNVVDKADAKIKDHRVGIEEILSHMAFEKPALYGIIALVVAIIAGFGVGMIFKGGGAH